MGAASRTLAKLWSPTLEAKYVVDSVRDRLARAGRAAQTR
jgi:hypothetical protein